MIWEWPLAVYLWLAGIAGGAYFAAFLMNRLTGEKYQLLPKIAMLLGVPLVLLGSLLLVLDLGERLRAWHLFTRFRLGSPMSIGSWVLLIYALIGIVMLALWWARSFEPREVRLTVLPGLASVIRPAAPALTALSWIAVVLAAFLIAYTGVLLSATSQPLWSGVLLLPSLFVASAVSTGMALLVLAARTPLGKWLDLLFGGEGESVAREGLHAMGVASLILGVIELVVLVGFLVWLAAFSTPNAADAVQALVFGPLGLVFWGGVVLVGLIIPLVLEFASIRGRETVMGSVLASASLVLLGGLFLRVVVLLSGQMT